MSAETHHDTSRNWMIFFFVCFIITVFSIGLWAAFFYHVDAPTAPVSAGE